MGAGKRLVSDLAAELGADGKNGLTEAEAVSRLQKYGRNEIVPKKKHENWLSFFAFLKEPMIWLLVGAAAIYFVLGDSLDAWIMLLAAIPIAAIDVIIEYNTENALEKLRKIALPRIRAIRNGAEQEMDCTELVRGDIFLVSEGEIIPADAVVLESSDLALDESALTGESQPVDKGQKKDYTEGVFSNQNVVFAGTTVMGGSARCLAFRTGTATEYGKIGKMIAGIETAKTPLQKNIGQIVGVLGMVAAVLFVFLFAMQVFVAGKGWSEGLLDAVSLAIAAIPEEFPVTFALFLSLGAWSLAKVNALVKRMIAVETLGSVTVICTDKTGTLTSGRMTLTHVYYDGEIYDADEFLARPHAKEVVEAAVLACEKNPFDPMEKSIFDYARKAGDPDALQARHSLEAEYSFDNKSKYMSHAWKYDGKLRLCAKGSVEGILARSKISKAGKEGVLKANAHLAQKGMRLLALAKKPLSSLKGRKKDEAGMEFLALLVFSDPLREGVPQAVRECEAAGIRVMMLTGDHRLTASAIAQEIGFKDISMMEGSELARLPKSRLASILSSINVFSRLVPEQKLSIVVGLQAKGEVVAVTGDGVNDAPALKRADIGVAMGQRGTEVAREAAGLVLLDDNFVTIVQAIKQGRAIYDNLKKVFSYLIAFHVPILLSALFVPLLGLPLLLAPIHIIFLELFLHPVISIVFQQEPPEEGVMQRPPRRRDSPIVNLSAVKRLVFEGALLFALCLAAYWAELPEGEFHARSLAFTLLVFGEAFLMIGELAGKRNISIARIAANRSLIASLAITIAGWTLLGGSYLAQEIFKITPLTLNEVLLALGLALIPLLACEAWKALWHE